MVLAARKEALGEEQTESLRSMQDLTDAVAQIDGTLEGQLRHVYKHKGPRKVT